MKIEANSGDSVDKVNYFLGNGKDNHAFEINKMTGDLCTRKLIDREQQEKYELQAIANDGKYESSVSIIIGNVHFVNWFKLIVNNFTNRNSG